MWTIEQANRAGVVVDVALVTLLGVMGLAGFLQGRPVEGVVLAAVAAAVAAASFWRPRSEGPALFVGRANDERHAAVQLRAWALVGQVYMVGFMALAAVAALRGGDENGWLLLVGVGGLTGLLATAVLRRRT